MSVELKTHIELHGDNPLQARVAGTSWKAALVAKFILGWGIDHAVEHYGFSYATAHAVMAFYYDNQETIELAMQNADAKIRESGTSIDERIAKLKNKLSD